MSIRLSCLRRLPSLVLLLLLLTFASSMGFHCLAATQTKAMRLASTPPMGWNDWAHYQCSYTGQDILANAKQLVNSGLAARGYNTVTIDDCWMQKDRDAHGNLQADPQRFPQGMKTIAKTIHALGLKFGIYEDAGYATCDGLAGSGEPDGGGRDYFLQDARLFASWGVDYLKLDGCRVYVPQGVTEAEAYRKAYAAESAALKTVGRPIIFSESAPAYFQNTPEWYDVLTWLRDYGQLWREGSDMANFHASNPDNPRFYSVLWNYSYNLPLGRFQKPGNWNDADFIIGGDAGMTMPETRSQLVLWSMMSAPLILSSDLSKLSPQAIAILGNKSILAIDQDRLGEMATLVRRSPTIDVLFKKLSGGDYAIAVLNHGTSPAQLSLRPADFGFSANSGCRLDARNLWDGTHASISTLQAKVATDDTAIWRVHATPACGVPTRSGAIVMIVPRKRQPHRHREPPSIAEYTRCLSSTGAVETCTGTPAERWTISRAGSLKSAGRCLAVVRSKVEMKACTAEYAEHWKYTLVGNLIGAHGQCLTASGDAGQSQSLSLEACGHNLPSQIWSLPN